MIAVTGATGFVGRQLCATLAAAGKSVQRFSRVQMPGYLALGDIAAVPDWSTALEGADAVVHLAARVHQRSDTVEADDYRRVNVDATVRLGEAARAAGVRRLVFLSSIKVNGDSTAPGRPFTEGDAPSPGDAYARSKLEAEAALLALDGIEVSIIRPPLVYGPGVRANFAALMGAAARGVPLPLGAVENLRSLIGVSNLCDLIVRCVAAPEAAGEVFVAADAETVSTAELLRRLAAHYGRTARLIPVPPTLLETVLRLAGRGDLATRLLGNLEVDASKARRLLGWSPPLTLDEGLAAAVRG